MRGGIHPVVLGFGLVGFILGGLAISHKVAGWRFDNAMLTAEAQPISLRQQSAARAWFLRKRIAVSKLRAMPVEERAKRLGFLTYRYCEPGNMGGPNLLDLYRVCRTTCGGYAYVYRGLAKVAGLETRFVDFYTIPQQADHTAIEVKLPGGRWGFVDPTFGVVFTADGKPDGRLLSLAEVSSLSEESLSSHVVQAVSSPGMSYAASLDEQYGGSFRHSGMPISNYSSSEAISRDIPDELVILTIPIVVDRDVGNLKSDDVAVLEQDWLQYAMATIGAPDRADRVSPDASDLYNDREDRVTMLRLSALEPGADYRLELRAVNPQAAAQRIQLSGIGHDISRRSNDIQKIDQGVSTIHLDFTATADSAGIYAHNLAPKGMVRIFGIRLSRLNTDPNSLR